MLKRVFFFVYIFCLSISTDLFGQDVISLKGYLIDAETKDPVPYASIYLKDEPIGTISNTAGYFVFHVPRQYKSSSIVISAMGYANVEKQLGTFLENEKIFMTFQRYQLEEVQLKGSKDKVLTAKDIVKRAYQRIAMNYPNEPYILEGFV